MTRKDYELVAEQLRFAWARGDLTQGEVNNLAVGLADSFKRDNPRFDRERFLNACEYYRKKVDMTNLLKETADTMLNFGKSPADIIFIGSEESGHSCTWEEFVVLANQDYNAGYGAAQVATDLIIVFNDGSRLEREEYDGAEWWEFRKPFQMPTEIKPIVNLFGGCWDSLEKLQKGDDYA